MRRVNGVLRFAAIIVAAGNGTRFGRPKQLIEVAGKPMIAWSIETFEAMPEIRDLIIVTEPVHIAAMTELAARHAPRLKTVVRRGGATRQESVRAGLDIVPEHCEGVFVHDGARPLVHACDVRAGMRATAPGTGALLAAPVVDTIKIVAAENRKVTSTLDRRTLWAAQTPQFALTADLRRAHADALRAGYEATDDAMLLERVGLDVLVIESTEENFKVSHPCDRDRAEALLRERCPEFVALEEARVC
jgi:2-C-methyl-D-erythritol 4-phosphate cytidylyltransferase